ncbi:hypothetical protein KL921_004058 [Ogataea angusta]|uniref:J domain-containing protein n=1 Tax=Pichia angusta TaxID=870730 RepID=A0AAN6DCB1_PICAN|nr:uncharacterized protein KL928_004278 [Ogataea angusta]KAG7807763.1 hypothetical protein KL921_004058 [Ogataea angusta]KAG7816814.1 hypothetical protein KL928_004278 [Ogataea angusta]KAG7823232.1 hypothetical protein KL909_003255 [Ogataea angusta]KAG7838116.1 hypothetical protein KL943_000192 [Ogataea angusta]KAG7856579.1 hypothetical protein KL919_004109 [Ogataea angusta]
MAWKAIWGEPTPNVLERCGTALTAKSAISAYSKFVRLTPQQIAILNNINIKPINSKDPFWMYKGGFYEKMNETEALLILEIQPNEILHLTHDIVKKRHRKMMLLNHPDKGGSEYLALKINRAKEVLEQSYMFTNSKD